MSRYGVMKRASDWAGVRIRTTKELRNMQFVVPAGSLGTVSHVSRGLALQMDRCPHCGASVYITRVNYSDVIPERAS